MEIKIENILILWDEKVTDIFVSLINTLSLKIENILILWDEKVTDIFVNLINTLSLSFSEKEIRNSMAKLSENENFGRLFAYGFGAHHLWVAQRMITDPEKVMENRLLIVEF